MRKPPPLLAVLSALAGIGLILGLLAQAFVVPPAAPPTAGELEPTAYTAPTALPIVAQAPTQAALAPELVSRSDSAGMMGRGDLGRSGAFGGPDLRGPAGISWQVPAGGGLFASPIVAGDTVYTAGGDGTIGATDRASGRQLWQVSLGNWVLTTPALAYGLLFVGDQTGLLYALDARTGAEVWRTQLLGEAYSAPAVADGVLYTGSGGGTLYALDARTGATRWTYAAQSSIYTAPALDEQRVYVGGYDGRFVALDRASGAERWSFQAGGAFASTPAVRDGTVYAGSYDGQLYALSAESGALRWQARLGAEVSAPAVGAEAVYAISKDGVAHALSTADGRPLWRFALGGHIQTIDLLAPSLAGATLYVGSDGPYGEAQGALYALDAGNGTERWRIATLAGIRSSPTIADGVLYVGDAGGNLYALAGAAAGGR